MIMRTTCCDFLPSDLVSKKITKETNDCNFDEERSTSPV